MNEYSVGFPFGASVYLYQNPFGCFVGRKMSANPSCFVSEHSNSVG